MPNYWDIERDSEIRFHVEGTLKSITRWVNTHEDGIAEWLKNTRRAYCEDRTNVAPSHRIAILLLKDKDLQNESCIGLLDVGGLTLEDVESWSNWMDPHASERAATSKRIEETQGNGGKSYMYNLFEGPARILGVRDNIKNCKGFLGEPGTEERGKPGFIPSVEKGKNVKIKSFLYELAEVLENYKVNYHQLPPDLKEALEERKSFTLVEGINPKRYDEEIPAEDLSEKIIKNPQALLPLKQLKIYVAHNGEILRKGKPLEMEILPPHKGFESPRVIEIPESLPDDRNVLQSTTEGDRKHRGRLTLYTSHKDISRKLKPQWSITYKTTNEIIGTLCVGEIIPTSIPGSQFIFGEVELDALSPDYVKLGRERPNPGPLLSALNIFIADNICQLAEEVNERYEQDLDEKVLDDIHEENKFLDKWKNKFFSEIAESITGPSGSLSNGGFDEGGKKVKRDRGSIEIKLGGKPQKIDLNFDNEKLIIGRGVKIHLSSILCPIARDIDDNPIPNADFTWWSNNQHIANFSLWSDELDCKQKGTCNVYVRIKDTDVKAVVPIEIWELDHVLLTPRENLIPLGTRRKIIAEVTNDEGKRSTDVLLHWKHDAKDQLIVRIHPTGWVTGNRLGKTVVYAGAGQLYSRIGAEIEVAHNPDLKAKGEGFPTLLVTERDIDPETGTIRKGDAYKEPLWQEVADVRYNVWWLNMQNPQVAFAFKSGGPFWRLYHSEKLVEMFTQALMQNEFTRKGDEEDPLYWGTHKERMNTLIAESIQAMWGQLEKYIEKGREALT